MEWIGLEWIGLEWIGWAVGLVKLRLSLRYWLGRWPLKFDLRSEPMAASNYEVCSLANVLTARGRLFQSSIRSGRCHQFRYHHRQLCTLQGPDRDGCRSEGDAACGCEGDLQKQLLKRPAL